MTKMFEVVFELEDAFKINLFFDNQDRAERFIHVIKESLSEKGKNELKMDFNIVQLIDSDDDIIDAFGIMSMTKGGDA